MKSGNVFTVPKMLRPHFRFDRKLLGKLSRCAYDCLKEFFRKTLDKIEGVPGVVVSIQTFGDLINFHPHLHCLVTDGCFLPNGWFYVLPEIDVKKLQKLFQHKVLKLLLKEKRISQEWAEKLLSWRNSGFNIHNQVKIRSDDSRGRESLAQYILRSPFSQEKMTYWEETKTVLYRAKLKPGSKKNFAVFPVLDWIATLTAHIPNKGEQLVRYYGYYSNVSLIPLPVPSARGKCASLASLTSLMSSKRSFNTWVSGKSPTRRQIEVRQKKRSSLIPHIAS